MIPFHASFTPERSFCFKRMAKDSVRFQVGLSLYYHVQKRVRRFKSPWIGFINRGPERYSADSPVNLSDGLPDEIQPVALIAAQKKICVTFFQSCVSCTKVSHQTNKKIQK